MKKACFYTRIWYFLTLMVENKQDNLEQAITCLIRVQEFYNEESYPVY
ncbi:MAG: hypothetical protein MGG11_12835 [Trichodesmium sp. MAG_R03]|jgi:hypothetical protein|nr:hypothetical protein [Trichodesmium sp. MAG_R03]